MAADLFAGAALIDWRLPTKAEERAGTVLLGAGPRGAVATLWVSAVSGRLVMTVEVPGRPRTFARADSEEHGRRLAEETVREELGA